MPDEIEPMNGSRDHEAGGPDFPLRVDALRRAGRLEEALAVALAGLSFNPERLEGRVALALVHLDSGRVDAARDELGQVLGTTSETSQAVGPQPLSCFDEGVGPGEIESAFDRAEVDPAPRIDAHNIAERAIEQLVVREPAGAESAPVRPVASPTFRTETMAELLERQGDSDGARAIRQSLRESDSAGGKSRAAPSRRERTLATLENWLRNIGRGAG